MELYSSLTALSGTWIQEGCAAVSEPQLLLTCRGDAGESAEACSNVGAGSDDVGTGLDDVGTGLDDVDAGNGTGSCYGGHVIDAPTSDEDGGFDSDYDADFGDGGIDEASPQPGSAASTATPSATLSATHHACSSTAPHTPAVELPPGAPRPVDYSYLAAIPTVELLGTMPLEPPKSALDFESQCTLCSCGCGGVSAESLRLATRPLTRGPPVYQPDPRLKSVMLPPSEADAELLAAAVRSAEPLRRDAQMVLEGGCGPNLVNLLETSYPTCHRAQLTVCFGGGDCVPMGHERLRRRACYGGTYQQLEYTASREMPLSIYRLGYAKWRQLYDHLPAKCRACAPDMCSVQFNSAAKGDFMGYHTDERPPHIRGRGGRKARKGKVTFMPDSAVFSVSAGETMSFFWRKITSVGGAEVASEQYSLPLTHGCTWLWQPEDDQTKKHGVWWPTDAPKEAERMVFVFRWSQHVRMYDPEYPHYVVLSPMEREKCERARAEAVARARRWKERPECERVQPRRSCREVTHAALIGCPGAGPWSVV